MSSRQKIGANVANYFKASSAVLAQKFRRWEKFTIFSCNIGYLYICVTTFSNVISAALLLPLGTATK